MRSACDALSLERRFYVDEQLFAREQSAIFSQSWFMLGRDSEWGQVAAPTSACYKTFDMAGLPIVLTRTTDGSLRGFHNVCRHRGAAIVDQPFGCLEKGVLTCPYHGWSYDSAGYLVGAPNMFEVSGFRREEFGLRPVKIATAHGFIFASVLPGPPTIESVLSSIHSRLDQWSVGKLDIAATIEYDVHANWKLLFENYSECYHCPKVHPALNRLTPYRGSSNEWTCGAILGGPMSLADGIETMSLNGRFIGPPLPNLDADAMRSVYYFTVFPNFFLSLHPDYVLVHRLEPRSVNMTRVVCQFLLPADSIRAAGFNLQPALEFWDMTNRQDWSVCERVQRGARSPAFSPGPLSNLESIVAAFDRHYRESLGE